MGITHSHDHEETERILVAGRPDYSRCDNTVITAKFTAWTFLPLVSLIANNRENKDDIH